MGGGHLVLLTGYITGTACRPVNFFAILISGTHCRKPFSFRLFTVIKSSIPLLSSTLPGPNDSDVTTLWRYTNLLISTPDCKQAVQ